MSGVDAKLGRVVPGYMSMGASGMAEMSTMKMQQPRNSISMLGGQGKRVVQRRPGQDLVGHGALAHLSPPVKCGFSQITVPPMPMPTHMVVRP